MKHGMGGMACPTCGCSMGHGHHMGGPGMKGMGGGMKAMFMMMPMKVMMHADRIGLSGEQVESLRNRHAEAQKQMIQIGSQIKMDMIDVKNAVMREEMDMATAESKVREIGKLKGDMAMTMIQAMQDMRHILTDDQRKKVKEMVMSWMKKGGMHGMATEESEDDESDEESED